MWKKEKKSCEAIPHVFPFVLLGDDQITAVGLEVVDLNGAVSIVLDRESRVDHSGYVTFTAPDQKEKKRKRFQSMKRNYFLKKEITYSIQVKERWSSGST